MEGGGILLHAKQNPDQDKKLNKTYGTADHG
jgi:hypothetical protein